MLKTGWKMLITGALLIAVAMLTACGGGAGTSSSSGSLAIALDKTEVASGSPVVATVTLTSLTGAPVNGVRVRVVSSDTNVINSQEGYTNTSGVASISLPAQWVTTARTVTLQAQSDGITPSTSVSVNVVAPLLTIGIPETIEPPAWKNNYAFTGKMITSGYQLKFVDASGNPVVNQVINLYVDSLVNKGVNDQIVYTPVQGSMIVAPPGVFTDTTDAAGIINIPMYIQMDLAKPYPCTVTDGVETCSGTALSVMTAKWKAVTVYKGQTITMTSSSLITFTNTGS